MECFGRKRIQSKFLDRAVPVAVHVNRRGRRFLPFFSLEKRIRKFFFKILFGDGLKMASAKFMFIFIAFDERRTHSIRVIFF